MYQIQTLANGVRLIHEYIPHVSSVAVGIFVHHGSAHEPPELAGIAHAIEHMVFKGTESRSAEQLAMEMDAIGGHVNAYTSKSSTCYHIQALDEHTPAAIELLCDIFLRSAFDEDAWETERGVIYEEINMYEDYPNDVCFQKLYENSFTGPYARSVLGSKETLGALTAEQMKAYKLREYRPGSVVVSVAGHFTPAHLEQLAEQMSALVPSPVPAQERSGYRPGFSVTAKETEQNHLAIAFPGLPLDHPDRYVAQCMISILGGGMSSRLFQKVREQAGLCYSVYAFRVQHVFAGINGIYTALGKDTERQAIQLIMETLDELRRHGPDQSEVERVREQFKASILIEQESTVGRMNHMGSLLAVLGHVETRDEIVAAINAVTREQVAQMATTGFDMAQMSFAAVGHVESQEVYQSLLQGKTPILA